MFASGRFVGLSKCTVFIMVAALAIGLVHHTDHVLRFDHSGWPFRSAVNPFTYSLLAYPIALFALFGPARLFWVRWLVLLVGAGFTLWAHTAIETPEMQFAMGRTITVWNPASLMLIIFLTFNLASLASYPLASPWVSMCYSCSG